MIMFLMDEQIVAFIMNMIIMFLMESKNYTSHKIIFCVRACVCVCVCECVHACVYM